MTKAKREEQIRNRCRLAILGVGAALCLIPILAYPEKEPIPEVTEESETELDNIRWKEETETVEIVIVEPVEIITVMDEIEPVEKIRFYDVPLSEELQLHIFEECDKHSISPAIVIAMIERESSYRASVIGDNGNSLGLMQIQPRWHEERMVRLGCENLLDPFQNVTVGIDILSELIETNSDLYWVLMAYNGGESYANSLMNAGKYSDYAIRIVERASELEDGAWYEKEL